MITIHVAGVATWTPIPHHHVLPWELPVLRLIEKRVPTLCELLVVLVSSQRGFLARWIVVEDLWWLLFSCDHSFHLVQDLLVDVGHSTALLFALVELAMTILLSLLKE